jgi:hypothetical protein
MVEFGGTENLFDIMTENQISAGCRFIEITQTLGLLVDIIFFLMISTFLEP